MSPFLDSAYSFPTHSLCHPDVCPGNPPSPFSRMQAHSGHFQHLTFFPPTKDLDPVFSLSAVHAIVSHSSATILMAHFHPRTNCMEKALGVQHTRKRKTSLLPPEDSELQHRKMTLARSISSYGSTHQTSVCNTRTTNPFPSELREQEQARTCQASFSLLEPLTTSCSTHTRGSQHFLGSSTPVRG